MKKGCLQSEGSCSYSCFVSFQAVLVVVFLYGVYNLLRLPGLLKHASIHSSSSRVVSTSTSESTLTDERGIEESLFLSYDRYVQGYVNQFKRFPNFQNSSRYLVYTCESRCGGLGDRLKGIVQVYILSVLSRRRFAIHWTDPCPLTNFLLPRALDWTLDLKGKTVQRIDYKEPHLQTKFTYENKDLDPEKELQADVILMKGNQEWTDMYRKLSVAPERFPELFSYSNSDLARIIYHGLFKRTQSLELNIDGFFKTQVHGKKLACFHARMGEAGAARYSIKDITPVFEFLQHFNDSDKYKVFVASDEAEVKRVTNELLDNTVDTSGPLVHIDQTAGSNKKCEGFMRAMVDHAVLSYCDDIVLTNSGFGVSAVQIRHSPRGINVYFNTHGVFQVHRDNIRQAFQYYCTGLSGWSRFPAICDG